MRHSRILILTLSLALSILGVSTSFSHPTTRMEAPQDTTRTRRSTVDTSQVDTLHNVVVKPKLGMTINPNPYDIMPSVKGLGDYIPGPVTDRIMHPFAIKQRKREKHKKKMMKALRDYDRVKSPNEQLIEALRREGIDPDSLRTRQKH